MESTNINLRFSFASQVRKAAFMVKHRLAVQIWQSAAFHPNTLNAAFLTLKGLNVFTDSWSQALAIRSSPGSLPATLKQVSNMVDEIWYGCGDTSADLSWYTKRATLAGEAP